MQGAAVHPRDSLGCGHEVSLGPGALVGADRLVGNQQPAPLALPDQVFDRVEQQPRRDVVVLEFSDAREVVPGNPDGSLDQLRCCLVPRA